MQEVEPYISSYFYDCVVLLNCLNSKSSLRITSEKIIDNNLIMYKMLKLYYINSDETYKINVCLEMRVPKRLEIIVNEGKFFGFLVIMFLCLKCLVKFLVVSSHCS